MTTVYFIRHAESDNSEHNGRIRPLTEKGVKDRGLVTAFLGNKGITAVLSSPFQRALDTVAPFAEAHGLTIEIDEDFRERKSDSEWLRDTDFWPFIERQWADFHYKLSDGEHLHEVQHRNIAALFRALEAHDGGTLAIGTHGTTLSTIVNYFNPSYGFRDFMGIVHIMPLVVKMVFDKKACISIRIINLFEEAVE